MSVPIRILFRADAGSAYGTGHVMRARSLAQRLIARGIDCALAASELPERLIDLLYATGIPVHWLEVERGSARDTEATVALAARLDAAALVVDSFAYGVEARHTLRSAARVIVSFDDLADTLPLRADIVVNGRPGATPELYPEDRAAGAELLLGPAYAPVRYEIASFRPRVFPLSERGRVLVMLGGTDHRGLTAALTAGLVAELPPAVGIDVAIAGDHGQREMLEAMAKRQWRRLRLFIDRFDLGDSMLSAGLAICGGGSTTAELGCLGVPAVLAILADNQAPSVTALVEAGAFCAVDLRGGGGTEILIAEAIRLWYSAPERGRLAGTAARLYDGRGADRIAGALIRHTEPRG